MADLPFLPLLLIKNADQVTPVRAFLRREMQNDDPYCFKEGMHLKFDVIYFSFLKTTFFKIKNDNLLLLFLSLLFLLLIFICIFINALQCYYLYFILSSIFFIKSYT
ncbi:hypothetical protein GLGR_3752 [Leminorella grimontii ATCC 33999 = DSM 5078]|nr:hypothetical protein GLGR_3752 [Leminorella grimontii ATCC 33999 = DSM 5078]